MQDIYSHLKEEHKEVRQILERIDETTDRAEKTREGLLLKLEEGLIPHMKGEEKSLYPMLLDHKKSRQIALEGIEEHKVASSLLRELGLLPKDTDKWRAKFSVFMENVNHHIEEEEGELFPMAQEVLNASDQTQVSEAYVKEEEKQKDSLLRKIERKVREKV